VATGQGQGPPKKPYEITYKPKSIAELQAEQKEMVDKVAALLECDVGVGYAGSFLDTY
jgi:hypothetical protein